MCGFNQGQDSEKSRELGESEGLTYGKEDLNPGHPLEGQPQAQT